MSSNLAHNLISTANNMAKGNLYELAVDSQALRQPCEDPCDEFTEKLNELMTASCNGTKFLSQNNVIDNNSNHWSDSLKNYCDEKHIYSGRVLIGEMIDSEL